MSSQYALYDPTFVPDPFGLNNTGVICWLNSILQVLLSCPALNETLMVLEGQLTNNTFAREYISLLKAILPNKPDMPRLDSIRYADASAKILKAFLMQMRSKGKTIRMGYSQECVDEAFTLFIETFDCPAVTQLFTNVYELIIECSTCKKTVSSERDKALRIELFCNKRFNTEREFLGYLLRHPSEHDRYTCEQCGNVMTKFPRIEILRVIREIVIIIFNKFQQKDNMWFPLRLSIPARSGGSLDYKLVGQIEHGGTMHGGHYTAMALRGDKVYRFNDSSVSPAEFGPTPNTYMLVYHLVSAPQN